jgi:RNA polymerase sigma-70 factor (ECF subfamily)
MTALARRELQVVAPARRNFDPERLVSAIAAGDDLALVHFRDATSGLLFGQLLLILNDTGTAETVLLEVYAEVRQRAPRFQKNHEALLTWLITIAHRRALEHLCASGSGQEFMVSVGLAGPQTTALGRSAGISKSAHRRLIGATLDALSPAERRMIELAYFSRLTTHAIAERLRQTPEAVRVGLDYGVARLYNLFKNQELVRDQ